MRMRAMRPSPENVGGLRAQRSVSDLTSDRAVNSLRTSDPESGFMISFGVGLLNRARQAVSTS